MIPIGTTVRIKKNIPLESRDKSPKFIPEMDKYLGYLGKIKSGYDLDKYTTYLIDFSPLKSSRDFNFIEEWFDPPVNLMLKDILEVT